MANDKINLIIKCKNSSNENSIHKLFQLKSNLEKHNILLVHLEVLNHLIVNTTKEKWERVIAQQPKHWLNEFELIENRIV